MARAWRIGYEGVLYHVLSRGNEKQNIAPAILIIIDWRNIFLPQKEIKKALHNVLLSALYCWCPGRELNSHSPKDRGILSPLRLPIPPPGHFHNFQGFPKTYTYFSGTPWQVKSGKKGQFVEFLLYKCSTIAESNRPFGSEKQEIMTLILNYFRNQS